MICKVFQKYHFEMLVGLSIVILYCGNLFVHLIGGTITWRGQLMLIFSAFILWLIMVISAGLKRSMGIKMYEPMPSWRKIWIHHKFLDAELLSNTPNGLYIGCYFKWYVCIKDDPMNIMHSMVIGSTGSGKTSNYILTTILAGNVVEKSSKVIFAIDIKGELYRKATSCVDRMVRVFSVKNRYMWGYDVFYGVRLAKEQSEKIYQMDIICKALINSQNKNNDFWVTSARDLLKGFLFYGYERKWDFIEAVQKILSTSAERLIDEILSSTSNYALSNRYLSRYAGCDARLLSNIEAQMHEKLAVFQNPDVVYALRDNERRITPLDLEEGYNLFLAIDEALLDPLKDLLRLIVAQTFHELVQRSEDEKTIVWMCLDEFARLGRIEDINNQLSTLRSRKVSIMLCFQSLNGLQIPYTPTEVKAIMANCRIKIILDAEDPEDYKYISQMVGTYEEKQRSIHEKGGIMPNISDSTLSTKKEEIITAQELRTLAGRGKCLLLTPTDFYFVRKHPYYQDDRLMTLSEKYMEERKNYENR